MQNELLNLRQEKIILQDEMTKNSEKVKLESQNFDEKILKNRNIDQTLLEQLAKQMDDIQSERKIEKRERDSLNQDNTNLRQVVTSLNDKITSLNDKITSLDQDNTYLKQEVKNLNDRVSILEFEKAILTIYDISNYLIPIPEMSQKIESTLNLSIRNELQELKNLRTNIAHPSNLQIFPKQLEEALQVTENKIPENITKIVRALLKEINEIV